MSWDISMIVSGVKCDCCGSTSGEIEIEIGNYTYNVSPMYVKAMGFSLNKLDGMSGEVVHIILTAACHNMNKTHERDDYLALNPKNGWGNFRGALDYLEKIRDACETYPNGKLRVF